MEKDIEHDQELHSINSTYENGKKREDYQEAQCNGSTVMRLEPGKSILSRVAASIIMILL